MNKIPSILMVSWNRREYFERTVAHILADPSDFRLHFWDNGSQDGVADIITSLRDDRIVAKHLHPENVKQFAPWHWFLDGCTTDIAGKYDDDILGEPGWMTRFADMLADEPRLGLLAAWVYMASDWDAAAAAHKYETIGGHQLFSNLWVPGGIFLGRLEMLRRYSRTDPGSWGVPIDSLAIWNAGMINGYPLPLSFAEHMDDPRSAYCRMNRPGGWDEFAAYTARMRGFTGPADYGDWIAKDARAVLEMPIAEQIKSMSPSRTRDLRGKVTRLIGRLGG
ncbi:MAG: glycosyltransferase family 2 protein [Sphingomonadaceae bacterium]